MTSLWFLSIYIYMGIMNCKLLKLSHTEHQQNLLRKNAMPQGKELPIFQMIIVLSMSVLDKGTTLLQKVGNHSPTDTAYYLRKHEPSATLL
jgi:hypothetical protein